MNTKILLQNMERLSAIHETLINVGRCDHYETSELRSAITETAKLYKERLKKENEEPEIVPPESEHYPFV